MNFISDLNCYEISWSCRYFRQYPVHKFILRLCISIQYQFILCNIVHCGIRVSQIRLTMDAS